MLRISIAIICMIFNLNTCGMSISQFLGHYKYTCYYTGEGHLYMNLFKVPCHDLTITKKDDNCFDGFLYNFYEEKRYYHISIKGDLPRIYNKGKRISINELHEGDVVMVYTNWQFHELGAFNRHCDGRELCWVQQIELLECSHNLK